MVPVLSTTTVSTWCRRSRGLDPLTTTPDLARLAMLYAVFTTDVIMKAEGHETNSIEGALRGPSRMYAMINDRMTSGSQSQSSLSIAYSTEPFSSRASKASLTTLWNLDSPAPLRALTLTGLPTLTNPEYTKLPDFMLIGVGSPVK